MVGFICSAFKRLVEKSEGFEGFMSGKGPRFEPTEVYRFDVFVSYSVRDSKLALEIAEAFSEKGLVCFLSEKDIRAGKIWREEIRDALWSSRVVVVLLTPDSVKSKWVMCEAGAFWVLKKPLIPAYVYVEIDELPELISEHQCRHIEASSDRAAFINEVFELCGK